MRLQELNNRDEADANFTNCADMKEMPYSAQRIREDNARTTVEFNFGAIDRATDGNTVISFRLDEEFQEKFAFRNNLIHINN